MSDDEVVALLSRLPSPEAAVEPEAVGLSEKVAFLSSPAAYPGDAGPVSACETSMSWVFLTDRRAYKMKTPIRRERLDFATLERRRHFCEEEVRLNRRLAPDVYLGVLALTRDAGGALALGENGDAVEWLVTMRRLPATGTLEALALSGRLRRRQVRAVAERMAAFYAEAPPEPFLERDYRQRFRRSLAYTSGELKRPEPGLPGDLVHRAVERLSRYIDVDGRRLDERVRAGRVLEGHGDLRPEHVYLEPDLVVTDCLEFDRDLRLTDPVDELGYLALECERLGQTHVEAWLLEAYGERTGDCAPADLVAFYKGCRALRRAMLAVWHLDAPVCRDRGHWRHRAREYLDMAVGHAERLP